MQIKSGPKVMKGFILAFDVWVSDPKSEFFGQFCQFLDIQTSGRIGRHVCHTKIFCHIVTGGKVHVL